MTGNIDKSVDLKHYVRLILRRKAVLLLCTVTTLCAALIALAFAPSVYESEVTLMIEDTRMLSRELENLMVGGSQPRARYGVDEERLAQLIGRIRSRPFLEQVISLLRMTRDPLIRAQAERECQRHPEVTVEEMAMRILVKNLQSRIQFGRSGPGIYRIIVADYSPENAQLLARWISQLFVRISSQDALERIRAAHEFGVEQLRIYEEHLRKSERALEEYKHSLIEQTLTQSLVREDNLLLAEALHRRMDEGVPQAQSRLRAYTSALQTHSLETKQAALLGDPEMRDLRASLSSAIENELRNRLTSSTGDIGDWQASTAYGTRRQSLLQQIETIAARHHPALPSDALETVAMFAFATLDLQAQRGAVRTLANAIANFKRRVESSPGGEIELQRLENDVAMNQRLLQSFQSQLVASDLSRAVEMTKIGLQIEVLDPAHLPLSPSHPNRPKVLAAALFLGVLLGALFAFIGQTLDPVLRSLDDFTRTAPEPILGTIPLLSRMLVRHGWFRRHWVIVGLAAVLTLTGAFFVMREVLRDQIAATGVPVQLANPEEMSDADD
ncbi:MAG: hypothetical protein KAY32_10830 [Candidatus Eisenbacteria sp.]|nr:hypothetical protein [Candidatus Eisenbacteria bacterium]